MRVLVLGASGFLGGKLYQKLSVKSEHIVIGTCFKADRNGMEYIDVKNTQSVEELFHEFKPAVVVWCLLDMNNERELTDVGLPNIMKNLAITTKFIYVTTDAFIEGTGNFSEETELKHWNISNPLTGYLNAKIDAEEIVKNHEKHAIVRTGPLYGQNVEGNWDKRTSAMIEALSKNQRISRSSNLYKTFICVDDLAELICEIIDVDFIGLINAGPEQKESYYTFHKKMAVKLGLNESLIAEDVISGEVAAENGIALDTSMNTIKGRTCFKTRFRSV